MLHRIYTMTFRLVALLAVIIFVPGNLLATDYYRATTDLNVRIKAGTQYPVSFTLEKGTEVEILTKQQGWYHIKYSGKYGYVSAKHLTPIVPIQDSPVISSKSMGNEVPVVLYFVALVLVCWIVYRRMRYRQPSRTITNYYRGSSTARGFSAERGTSSELQMVSKLVQFGIPREHIFHDLYIVKNQSEFAQTDLVVLTQVGLLVIEVKEYSGWIFGDGNQSKWTQVLAYGKQKYYFYNPILQNKSHILELKKHLRHFEDMPFYSIVVFFGDCEFKSINYVPQGTLVVKANRMAEALSDILTQNPAYGYKDKDEVIRILKEAVVKGADRTIQQQHIENVKDKLGTDRIYD